MKGPDVKDYIKASGFTQQEAAVHLGIERETLNRLLGDPEKDFPKPYLTKLKEIGVKFEDVTKSDENYEERGYPSEHVLARALKLIEDNLEDLRVNNRAIINTNGELTDSHKTWRRIVEKCLDAGVLSVDKNKGVVKV